MVEEGQQGWWWLWEPEPPPGVPTQADYSHTLALTHTLSPSRQSCHHGCQMGQGLGGWVKRGK